MVFLLLLGGCSIKQVAVDMIGDALSEGGEVFASDEDPELIREAIPFGLKTYESLLEVSPEHEGLLLAAGKGFVAYAYLLQQEADLIDAENLNRARAMRARANRLYLRGRDHALRGLEVRHPGITTALGSDEAAALSVATAEDVPYLYWAGAGWAGALSAKKDELALVAELPTAGALVRRALELDEAYDLGAAHEFMISYEGGRPGGSAELARQHYERALALSNGRRASTYLALAETVVVREQDLEEFNSLLQAAMAVDPEAEPKLRLVNTIAQRRARWLETRLSDLFLGVELTELTR
ncbi:MAG: TRAP transporter TatT component family protein [Dongiaceae bacterium]